MLQDSSQAERILEMEDVGLENDWGRKFLFLCQKATESYYNKNNTVSDQKWMIGFLSEYFPLEDQGKLQKMVEAVLGNLQSQETVYAALCKAVESGTPKERWLEEKFKEAAIGISAHKYTLVLEHMYAALREENQNLTDALRKSTDGNLSLKVLGKVDIAVRGDEMAEILMQDGYYSSKEYVGFIGKNAEVMAWHMLEVTTGWKQVQEAAKEQSASGNGCIQKGLEKNNDLGLKVVMAGVIAAAHWCSIFPIPLNIEDPKAIADIAFVGVENTRIYWQLSGNRISLVKAMENLGRIMIARIGMLGTELIKGITYLKLILGRTLGVCSSLIAATIAYLMGPEADKRIRMAAQKIVDTVKRLIGRSEETLSSFKEKSRINKREALEAMAPGQ